MRNNPPKSLTLYNIYLWTYDWFSEKLHFQTLEGMGGKHKKENKGFLRKYMTHNGLSPVHSPITKSSFPPISYNKTLLLTRLLLMFNRFTQYYERWKRIVYYGLACMSNSFEQQIIYFENIFENFKIQIWPFNKFENLFIFL